MFHGAVLFRALLLSSLANAATHQLIVGTFGTDYLYTVEFDDAALTLELVSTTNTTASSSWLALSHDKKSLYGTDYGASTPAFVSYTLESGTSITYDGSLPLGRNCSNTKAIFVTAATKEPYAVYGVPFGGSAGCGSVMSVDETGALSEVIQNYTYSSSSGVHGLALDSENEFIYSADDSGNSLWTHKVDRTTGELSFVDRLDGPSTGSDPRHVTVHPEGKYLYVVLEGSNEIAPYQIDQETGIPTFLNNTYPLIPANASDSDYWSDEVALSFSKKYLWATSRGRSDGTVGYISAFTLADDGSILEQLFLTPTTTGGGVANAVTPSDFSDEWVALTDTTIGFVEIWRLVGNGTGVEVAAHLNITDGGCCANAVWYS